MHAATELGGTVYEKNSSDGESISRIGSGEGPFRKAPSFHEESLERGMKESNNDKRIIWGFYN